MNDEMTDRGDPDDGLRWLEFGCWFGLILMPALRWIHGPAVSGDQAVVRTALVIIALAGGTVLRLINRRRKRVASGSPNARQGEPR